MHAGPALHFGFTGVNVLKARYLPPHRCFLPCSSIDHTLDDRFCRVLAESESWR
jgi:hypothetical protein